MSIGTPRVREWPCSTPAARTPYLLGVVVAVGSIDLEPVLGGVAAAVAVGAFTGPIGVGHTRQDLAGGAARGGEGVQGCFDRPLGIAENAGKRFLVVAVDHWPILGQQAAQANG